MPDLRDRAREDESPYQRMLDFLPGFKGYRERELRRRADQLLRDHLVGLLDGERARLQRKAGDLGRQGKVNLDLMGPLDRTLGQLTKVRDKIRYADYGYTGWFDTPQIREDELDRLYEYDLSLRNFVASIQEKVGAVVEAEPQDLPVALQALDAALHELEDMIQHRDEVIQRVVP